MSDEQSEERRELKETKRRIIILAKIVGPVSIVLALRRYQPQGKNQNESKRECAGDKLIAPTTWHFEEI